MNLDLFIQKIQSTADYKKIQRVKSLIEEDDSNGDKIYNSRVFNRTNNLLIDDYVKTLQELSQEILSLIEKNQYTLAEEKIESIFHDIENKKYLNISYEQYENDKRFIRIKDGVVVSQLSKEKFNKMYMLLSLHNMTCEYYYDELKRSKCILLFKQNKIDDLIAFMQICPHYKMTASLEWLCIWIRLLYTQGKYTEVLFISQHNIDQIYEHGLFIFLYYTVYAHIALETYLSGIYVIKKYYKRLYGEQKSDILYLLYQLYVKTDNIKKAIQVQNYIAAIDIYSYVRLFSNKQSS